MPRRVLYRLFAVGVSLAATACNSEPSGSGASLADAGTASTDSVQVQDNHATVDSFYKALQGDYESDAVARKSLSFINNPFVEVGSAAEANRLTPYERCVTAAFEVRRVPERNRHDPAVTDTVVTIQFEGGSNIKLYRNGSGELFPMSADIRTPRATLRQGIRVGMLREDLLQALDEFVLATAVLPDRVEVESPEQTAALVFHLVPEEGVVSRIEYTGYVD